MSGELEKLGSEEEFEKNWGVKRSSRNGSGLYILYELETVKLRCLKRVTE